MFFTSHSQVQQLVTLEQELPNPDDMMEVTPPESDSMEITPTPGIYVCRQNVYVLLESFMYLPFLFHIGVYEQNFTNYVITGILILHTGLSGDEKHFAGL